MLAKKYRLDPKRIPFIAKRGKKFSGQYFDLKVWYDEELEFPNFALAVSTKVDQKAVVRNRIKRKMRAAIEELLKEDFFKKGSYLFIVKNNEVANLKQSELVDLTRRIY